ncbi:MAG: DMT family transporter, partial [Pseudomonadota bacterium]
MASPMDMRAPSLPAPQRAAIAFMLGAGAMVAATSLMAKALGADAAGASGLHPFQVSAGRFVFALCALAVLLAVRPAMRPTLTGAQWDLHLARSLCGWLGVTAMFAAVARMPVAEATAVSFLSPLVTMGLAALMLRERLGPVRLTAAGLALAGALLVLRPGTDAFQIAGLFALAAAALFGLESIFIKRLSDREPPLRILLINNLIGGAVSLVAASFVWSWPSPVQWLLLAALGTVMVTGQSMFIQAMRRGEASAVIPAFYSVLVFAALYDALLYGVVPDGIGATGAALIIGSAVLLA